MRISDWSSDVCSSDLSEPRPRQPFFSFFLYMASIRSVTAKPPKMLMLASTTAISPSHLDVTDPAARSEEHTSELQSLMRRSYAVFCLKKKKDIRKRRLNTNH